MPCASGCGGGSRGFGSYNGFGSSGFGYSYNGFGSNGFGGCGSGGHSTSMRLFDSAPASSSVCSRGSNAQLNQIQASLNTLDAKVNELTERTDTIIDLVTTQVLGEMNSIYDLLSYCCDEEQSDLRQILSLM